MQHLINNNNKSPTRFYHTKPGRVFTIRVSEGWNAINQDTHAEELNVNSLELKWNIHKQDSIYSDAS